MLQPFLATHTELVAAATVCREALCNTTECASQEGTSWNRAAAAWVGPCNFRVLQKACFLQQGKCAAAGKTEQQVMEQAVLLWHPARRPTHALVHNAVAQCRPYWVVLTSKTHGERLGAIAGVRHLKGHCGHQLALDNRDLGQLACAK